MLTNYIKIAIRSLLKFKGYAAINLLSLALGLTAGILILLYAADELSYDKFHTKIDRIYRVETRFVANKSAESESTMDANGWAVGSTLRNEFPEVEKVLYTRNASFLLVNFNDKRIREQIHFASPEFFDIFSFPLKEGNPATALTEPYSIVITEKMADKYFPGEDALNKTIVMADTLQLVVTGVMENIPSNSHIQLDMLISFATYTKVLRPDFSYDGGWGNVNIRNYVLLKEGVDVKSFMARAKNIYTDHVGELMKEWGVEAQVLFTPLSKLYLTTTSGNGMGPVGSISRVHLVTAIAGFVILLACINFINLTTARAVYRAREVGLRKVIGSTRRALIRQFLAESFALTILSLLVAVAMIGAVLPLFNQLLDKDYSMSALVEPIIVIGIVILLVVVALLSGYYPAVVMSRMRPAEVLKGKFHAGRGGVQLRRALVVFQFVISVGLVLGTLTVLDQLRFMQRQDLGFDKDQILVVRADLVRPVNPDGFRTFKGELGSLAMVENVTYANSLPGNPGWIGQVAYPEGRTEESVSVEYMAVDEDYIKTLGLEMVAGRGFDRDRQAELKDGLVLNETAVHMFGWASPEEAIGKKIASPSSYPAGEVIGVVKDYHQFGLQDNIGPMAMDYRPGFAYMYAIRYKAADTKQLIASVEELWRKTFPGYDFNYFFLDDDFEKHYRAEERLATVFAFFAGVTIFIAVAGLLGLVSFMVGARTKEIGVRKVLGADVLSITSLLSKEFVVLVCVATLIAFPLAWYAADQWLQHFATRVEVNPLLFLLALLIAVAVTLITISFQTIRAAMANPIQSLRYE